MALNGGLSTLVKVVLASSITANVTLFVSLAVSVRDSITSEQLKDALANAPYPWIADRQIVMDHVHDTGKGTMHEDGGTKLDRIRDEIDRSNDAVKAQMDALDKTIDAHLDSMQRDIDEIKAMIRNGKL